MTDRWPAKTLPAILDVIWTQWQEAAASTDHPLRLPVLATRTAGGVAQRMLVLRDCDQARRTITSYTDVRTLKVQEIRDDSHVAWHFYDARDKVQLRVDGIAAVHTDDDLLSDCWSRASTISKVNYIEELPPGNPVDAPTSNLPAAVKELLERGILDDERTRQLLQPGSKNFCVLVTTVQQIDWLHLKDGGHERCRFVFDESSQEFQGTWLAP